MRRSAFGSLPRATGGVAFDDEAAPVLAAAERQERNRAGGAYAWQRFEACGQLLEELHLAGLASLSDRHVEREHAIRAEAWLHRLHAQKAPHHQPRGRQQDERQRHFRGDQPRAHALAYGAVAAATAFMERCPQIGSSGLERRDETEHHARHQRDHGREAERGGIDRRFVEARIRERIQAQEHAQARVAPPAGRVRWRAPTAAGIRQGADASAAAVRRRAPRARRFPADARRRARAADSRR